ncbi:MAG: hypothetical protein HXY34_10770 [Candidatus Thorarchaeota archaeon]|nr:hypothetical protein [Candidatus Thorarchaeota archaeon]
MTLSVLVEPTDPLFFRSSIPFDAGETTYTASIFPPSASSGYGLSRAFVLEHLCKNIRKYVQSGCDNCPSAAGCHAREVVGNPSKRDGSLRTKGPYIMHDNQCRYPVPMDLTQKGEERGLLPGLVTDKPIRTDLGMTRLPTAEDGRLFRDWGHTHTISEASLSKYLSGEPVDRNDLVPVTCDPLLTPEWDWKKTPHHAVYERRTGIARDLRTRATREGHLYHIVLARMRENAQLMITLDGLNEQEARMKESLLLSFGGENRLAKVKPVDHGSKIATPKGDVISSSGRFKLVLLQHADFDGSWLPPGFKPQENEGITTWTGTLNGLELRLITARTGKAVQVGGWDMTGKRPRELRTLVPAGSVYYFESGSSKAQEIVQALHDRCVGLDTQIGLGHAVIGVW